MKTLLFRDHSNCPRFGMVSKLTEQDQTSIIQAYQRRVLLVITFPWPFLSVVPGEGLKGQRLVHSGEGIRSQCLQARS